MSLTAYSTDENYPIVAGTLDLRRKRNSFTLNSIPGTIINVGITATGERFYAIPHSVKTKNNDRCK